MSRTAKTVLGFILTLTGAAVALLSLYRGGLTWPVLLTVCALLTVGGHLVSHTQMKALLASVPELIRAWREPQR